MKTRHERRIIPFEGDRAFQYCTGCGEAWTGYLDPSFDDVSLSELFGLHVTEVIRAREAELDLQAEADEAINRPPIVSIPEELYRPGEGWVAIDVVVDFLTLVQASGHKDVYTGTPEYQRLIRALTRRPE